MCILGVRGSHRLQSGRVNTRREESKKGKRTTDCVDEEEMRKSGNTDAEKKGRTLFESAAVAGSLVLNAALLVCV